MVNEEDLVIKTSPFDALILSSGDGSGTEGRTPFDFGLLGECDVDFFARHRLAGEGKIQGQEVA
jgi:hypothetical protein